MTDFVRSDNAGLARRLRNLFKPRDIFLHEGGNLRRVRIGSGLQIGIVLAALVTFFWSIFAAAQLAAGPAPAGPELAQMEREVRAMQADVQAMKQVAAQRYQLTANELRRIGVDPARFQAGAFQGRGGPFEAVEPLRAADPNFKALFTSWKKLDQIEQGSIAIPSAQPVRGSALTSSYGVRSDPFRGRAAMHAGIDLAGPIGTPIYATADGKVGRSSWVNGYGNLVEIEHGRGIQTRYGHLSRSAVRAGQAVKRGDLIAYMGSTGRSTGSHLHYEVRIDGRAVNPVPFMQSSDYLQSVQRRAAAATQVAMGGPNVAAR